MKKLAPYSSCSFTLEVSHAESLLSRLLFRRFTLGLFTFFVGRKVNIKKLTAAILADCYDGDKFNQWEILFLILNSGIAYDVYLSTWFGAPPSKDVGL